MFPENAPQAGAKASQTLPFSESSSANPGKPREDSAIDPRRFCYVAESAPSAESQSTYSKVNWDRVIVIGALSLIAFLVVLEILQIAVSS